MKSPILESTARRTLPGALLPLLFAAASGCQTPCIAGSGNVVTETRALAAFDAIRIDGAATVRAVPAGTLQPGALELRVDDNLLPLITTEVDRGTLIVSTLDGDCLDPSDTLGIRVGFEGVKSIQINGWADLECAEPLRAERFRVGISGSGDVLLTDLEVRHLTTSIEGSGDVTYRGRVDEHVVRISGSAQIWVPELATSILGVEILGSGDVRAWVDEQLSVTISGSGDVAYTGNARASTSIHGSGSVRRVSAQ